MIKVVSWNIGRSAEPWRELAQMAEAGDVDVALLQEAGMPPDDVAVEIGPREHWDSHVWNSHWYKDRWPRLYDRWPMVVKLSPRASVEWLKQISPISDGNEDEIAVSGIGTIAAARVASSDGGQEPFIAISMYARWMRPHTCVKTQWRVGHADGSAHRIISDLSAFIGDTDPSTHRILAAGDLNMIYGSLGGSRLSLARREHTVWDRMEALGLKFLGPQAPNGRSAGSAPEDMPSDTKNVPTFYSRGGIPEAAVNQLDYAFASCGFHERVQVRAMNEVDDWGSSDHCRLMIEIA